MDEERRVFPAMTLKEMSYDTKDNRVCANCEWLLLNISNKALAYCMGQERNLDYHNLNLFGCNLWKENNSSIRTKIIQEGA